MELHHEFATGDVSDNLLGCHIVDFNNFARVTTLAYKDESLRAKGRGRLMNQINGSRTDVMEWSPKLANQHGKEEEGGRERM